MSKSRGPIVRLRPVRPYRFSPHKLRALMRRQGYGATSLGAVLSTSAQVVGAWLSGAHVPHADRIPSLCDLLDCGLGDLYVRA